jgi:hypothetical protein
LGITKFCLIRSALKRTNIMHCILAMKVKYGRLLSSCYNYQLN